MLQPAPQPSLLTSHSGRRSCRCCRVEGGSPKGSDGDAGCRYGEEGEGEGKCEQVGWPARVRERGVWAHAAYDGGNSSAGCDPWPAASPGSSVPIMFKVLHSVTMCCILLACWPSVCLLQVAMDMSNDEVGEAEDLMEAYWLQAGVAFSLCCIPGTASRCLLEFRPVPSTAAHPSTTPRSPTTACPTLLPHAHTGMPAHALVPVNWCAGGLLPEPPENPAGAHLQHGAPGQPGPGQQAQCTGGCGCEACYSWGLVECAAQLWGCAAKQASRHESCVPCRAHLPCLLPCRRLPPACRLQVALGLAVDLLLMMFEVHMAVTGESQLDSCMCIRGGCFWPAGTPAGLLASTPAHPWPVLTNSHLPGPARLPPAFFPLPFTAN
jgi:hypothetical protein